MQSENEIVQRWRALREMLIAQLDMLQSGLLTLRANGVDLAPTRIDELKREIFEFDGLIASRLRPIPGMESIGRKIDG